MKLSLKRRPWLKLKFKIGFGGMTKGHALRTHRGGGHGSCLSGPGGRRVFLRALPSPPPTTQPCLPIPDLCQRSSTVHASFYTRGSRLKTRPKHLLVLTSSYLSPSPGLTHPHQDVRFSNNERGKQLFWKYIFRAQPTKDHECVLNKQKVY